MSTETQVSNIYPIIFSLLKTHLLRSEDDSRRVGQFKLKVQQSLSTRMGPRPHSYSSQDLQTSQIPTRKAEEHCLPPSCSTMSPCSAPSRSYTLPSCPTQPQKTPLTITNG
ncbi:hypothetical protein AAFF_G00156360 [Aldrovandia affinis]|uniref:Uncharacterized protein n=1 Tax=Aldrovandia affinis TaxID=143900 RepID=A0AAD7VX84_9TELE|nr:hypothetical protein AAFF_G00156360 [Aldrovandia affinis]